MSRPAGPALLLIDVLNDFQFPESGKLLRYALPAARRIARLRQALKADGIPVIYVNDNFGRWQSDFKEQVARWLLLPQEDDYFVLKPKHSGFYATPLEVLLGYLGVRDLILTGFATDICVVYTANDAYMRDYGLTVVSDCVAAESLPANRLALEQMKSRLKARVVKSNSLLKNRS